MGTDVLQPTSPTSTKLFSKPNFGTDIHVIFGAPVDLTAVLALRSTPPFDRRPELLYEVIAHTLEEEVRGLRGRLHKRLGISPHIPSEGGAFDNNDGAVLHPDAVVARAQVREAQAQALDTEIGQPQRSATEAKSDAEPEVAPEERPLTPGPMVGNGGRVVSPRPREPSRER